MVYVFMFRDGRVSVVCVVMFRDDRGEWKLHDSFLKTVVAFYFSNFSWDCVPYVNSSGIK